MTRIYFTFVIVVVLVFGIGANLAADTDKSAPKAPSLNAGKIDAGPRPLGRIAFIKDGGIWIMDSDGKNRQVIVDITNASGRLSFSPDNKTIAFARKGQDANKLPSDEGGTHVLYDIFLAHIDSAATNIGWWTRATFSLGGSNPQWSDNDTMIYYVNDINAGFVDYIVPSMQLAKVSINDGHAEYLRKDWQSLSTNFMQPSFTRDGKKIAYLANYSVNADKYNFQNFGIRIIDTEDIMLSESEIRKPSPGLKNAVSPQWSPDGQWLAYLSNDMRNPGIYMIKSDLSENRLIFSPTISQQIMPHPVGWAPNSKWITFATADGTIYIIDINGENLTPLSGAGKHSNPAWSN
jgi:Tol biopolymer transport system component